MLSQKDTTDQGMINSFPRRQEGSSSMIVLVCASVGAGLFVPVWTGCNVCLHHTCLSTNRLQSLLIVTTT